MERERKVAGDEERLKTLKAELQVGPFDFVRSTDECRNRTRRSLRSCAMPVVDSKQMPATKSVTDSLPACIHRCRLILRSSDRLSSASSFSVRLKRSSRYVHVPWADFL